MNKLDGVGVKDMAWNTSENKHGKRHHANVDPIRYLDAFLEL